MTILFNKILRNTELDTENPGGGGGAVQWTKEQLEAIGGIVNSAITSHMKRIPTLADQLKDFKWEDVVAPIVQKHVPKIELDDPDTKGKGKGKELTEYEKQLAKLTTDFQNSEKLRVEAENKAKAAESARRTDAGKQKLRTVLGGNILEGSMEHVINHLTLVNNRLVVDDEGNTLIKVKRPEFTGGPPVETLVPVEDSLKDILSESDMKIFIQAPKGSGNSHPGPGGKGLSSASFTGEAKTDQEKLLRAKVYEEEFRRKYGDR